jgi:hypothetical protein
MNVIEQAIEYLTSDHDLDTRQEIVAKTLEILRAEPPIDGDRQTLDAMIESVLEGWEGYHPQEAKLAMGFLRDAILAAFSLPSRPANCEHENVQRLARQAKGDEKPDNLGGWMWPLTCVACHQEFDANDFPVGAAEPPSAPAPCPTNHGNGLWQKRIGNLRELRFCPDCGAFLGVPESEEA